jgi:hypothetical protein
MMKRPLTSIRVLGTLTKITDLSFDVELLVSTTRDYLQSLEQRCSNEGKQHAVAHYKQLHLCAIAIVTGDTLPTIPFCKTGKDKIPLGLKPLRYLLKSGNPRHQRLGLTITRCYEVMIGPAVWNPIPITEKGPTLSSNLIEGFNAFCQRWTKSVGIRNLKIRPTEKLVGRLVEGPNGPAIATSHYDAVAVKSEPLLYSNLRQLASLTGSNWIIETMENMAKRTPPGKYVSGRISLLQEGGCKTRTIGIGDYWSQNILRPIHDSIMNCLRKLETDGTFDQNKQVERILRECKGKAYSFDLTSATDRFPVHLQEILLSHVYDQRISKLWRNVLTQRDFHIKNERVRWEVGQPLGLLSSWAAFSLTHHAIIEYIAESKGFKPFRDYSVLGDDVVIWNPVVAVGYQELMREIGVSINLSKSLISDDQHNRVEFAKRILHNGVEVTGLKWDILDKAQKHLTMFPDLIRVSQERHYDLPWTEIGVPAYRSVKRIGLLAALLMDTLGVVPTAFAAVIQNSGITLEALRDKVTELRVASIKEKQASLDQFLMKAKPLEELFKTQGIYFSENRLNSKWSATNLHPVEWAINSVGEDLAISLSLLDMPPTGENPHGGYAEVEYLPLPIIGTYFGDRKDLITEVHSNMVMKAWSSLLINKTTSGEK